MPKKLKLRITFNNILGSKLFLVTSVIILSILLVILAKEFFRSYKIDKEIKSLESQVKNLENQNQELVSLLAYLQTKDFQEQAAKSKLFLRQPGEKVVAPLNLQEGSETGLNDSGQETNKDNQGLSAPWQWWKYFFHF